MFQFVFHNWKGHVVTHISAIVGRDIILIKTLIIGRDLIFQLCLP